MNRNINKRNFVLAILVFSFLILLGLPSRSWAEEKFGVGVKVGFDGYVVPDEITPVRIELRNNFKDMEGKVQLLIADKFSGRDIYIAYSKEINIAKGATKVLNMESTFYKNGNLFIRILDKGDNIVFEKKVKNLIMKKRDNLAMGVFSDNIDSIRYLSKVNSKINYNGNNKDSYFQIVELDEALPENHETLNIFSTIVINNYNSEILSKKQQGALEKWIEEGGLLLIGTGPNYNKALKGLELGNFLAVHGTKEIKASDLGSEEAIKLIDGDLIQGEKIIIDGKEELPFYHRQMGKGHVIIGAFDLGLAPFSGWNNNDEFMNEVINKYLNNNIINYSNRSYKINFHRYGNIVSYLPYNLFPSVKSILIILVLFILLVGPINYIVLKKLDKRILFWITIPLIVVLFSGSIYVLGFKTRLKQPIINNVSIINMDGEANTASVNTKAGIMGFKNGKLDVVFNKSSRVLLDNERDYDILQRFADGEIVTEYLSDKENHIIFNKTGILDVKAVTINDEIELDNKIESEVIIRGGKLIGTIDNASNFDLDDMVIFYGNAYKKLGDLKKGEKSGEFEIAIGSFGNNTIMDWHRILNNLYGRYNINNAKDAKDILNDNIKRDILDGLFDYKDSLVHRNRSFIIAWNKDDIIRDIKVNGMKTKRINRNLILIPLDIQYTKGQKITLPYGVLYPEIVDIYDMEVEDHKTILYGEGHVVLGFKPDENMELTSMKINIDKNRSKYDFKVYIYDFIENDWKETDEKNILIDASNKSKYYNENKGTLIKVDPDKHTDLEIPSFEVEGVIK